jgi:DNA-binding Lrp family transcriptional regulator
MPLPVYFLDNYHRLPGPVKNLEALIIIHLMRHKYDARAPFPSLKTISKKMGLSDTAVRVHVRNLEKKGVLRRELRRSRTSAYHFEGLVTRLEQLIEQDAQNP